ncbi:MAG: MFS transporter [Pseudomonadota bacterium]
MASVSQSFRSASQGYPSSGYAWTVVAILSFAGVVSYVDRTIMNLLVGPIRADLGISDTQFSLLQGIAFSFFYALLAIPLARLSDTGNRKLVIIAGVVCWTLATFASGLAASFAMLFAARMFIGVGEATLTPGGYSILGDYFPKEKLSAAVSVFTASSFLGSGIALILGGPLIAYLLAKGPQTLPVLGTLQPWQMTFILVSLPSVLVLTFLIFMKEPVRQAGASEARQTMEAASFADFWAFLQSKARVILSIYFGLSVLAAVLYGVTSWGAEFLMRTYGWDPAKVGLIFGPMIAVFGYSGLASGGFVCNRLIERGMTDANLRLPIISSMCCMPFAIAFGIMPNDTLSLICLAPTLFFGAMPFGIGTAALPLISPNRMRAQMVAGYLFIANLLSYGLGPTAIAAFSDTLGGGTALGKSFSVILPALLITGSAILMLGLKPYRALIAGTADLAAVPAE